MRRPTATARITQTGAAITRASLIAIALVAGLLATGCSVLHSGKDKKSDPLFGDHVPKDGSGTSGPSKTSSNVPPIPSASSSSNAALAMATLPGSKQLSIGEPERPPAKGNANATLTSNVPPGGATLSRPQPVVVPVPRESDVQAASGTNQDQTSEYFFAQLRARGVSWHRADSVAGGIRFACIVPNRQNPSVTRSFEATAPDFPSAVNAVLRQIDNQN